jgi:hypothetical protein
VISRAIFSSVRVECLIYGSGFRFSGVAIIQKTLL